MSLDLTAVTATTFGVRITVHSMFIPEQSNALGSNYVFAYRISIINETNRKVQLLRRFWEIIDGTGEIRIVSGDGVVGKQPVLSPGEEHTYVSGCVFRTAIGRMQGFYTMMDLESDSEFNVTIPSFLLITPMLLN